jgi:hypothetical protein
MEQLRELSKKLGNPGAQKLYLSARKRGIAVTRNQIKQFLALKPERQIFRPLPRSSGATGAEDLDVRWQMDLIEFRTAPSKVGRETFKYIIVLIEVFSRQVWAEPCKDKTPDSVEPVLRRMLRALPKKPEVISTDKGNEFTGAVQSMLDAKGIIRRTKDPQDVNALGVVDRAIQNLKKRLAESLSAEEGEWASRIKEVTAAYNSTMHESVHGEPEEVRGNPVQSFLILQDNATKLKGNQTLLESRKKQLADAGAFRRPLPGAGGAFRRGFKATYGDLERVASVQGSTVVPEDGVKIDIKRIQPVDRDSGNVVAWLGGLSLRDSAKKDKLMDMMTSLIDFLKDGERSVASAALWLKGAMGSAYEDTLREVGFGKHLAQALQLFSDYFELTKGSYYVKLVER